MAEAFAYRPRMPRIPAILDPSESHRGLSSLPIDVLVQIGSHLTLSSLLTFITLSRWMLCSLGPSIDYLVQSYIARNERWLLPPNDGGNEISWWNSMMRTAEQLHGDTFSWVGYLKACGESASMKNRARIWRISNQLAEMADDLNIAF